MDRVRVLIAGLFERRLHPLRERSHLRVVDLRRARTLAVFGRGLSGAASKHEEVREALRVIEELKTKQLKVEGDRVFNPGWNLAIDLTNLLRVSECIAKAAIEREESRGGHTRDEFPKPSPEWAKLNLICTLNDSGDIDLSRKDLPQMPPELAEIFEESKA